MAERFDRYRPHSLHSLPLPAGPGVSPGISDPAEERGTERKRFEEAEIEVESGGQQREAAPPPSQRLAFDAGGC